MRRRMPLGLWPLVFAIVIAAIIVGCSNTLSPRAQSGAGASGGRQPGPTTLARSGDEIVVCGQLFHIGTPVVTWMDPGGYDAYRTEKRFAAWEDASWEATTRAATRKAHTATTSIAPARYSMRFSDPSTREVELGQALTPAQIEMVRGGGWPLSLLQQKVDQFVIHYDVAGVSRNCFKTLHDDRFLSVHFMLDLDGTIYQTLDLKERAWQATKANDRSIGIEIANMGSYTLNESPAPLAQWYKKDVDGRTVITIPERLQGGGIRTPNFVGHPLRDEMIVGEIQGRVQRQYDYTPQQYAALIKLTAALCKIFPKIRCDYPRDPETGGLINHALTPEEYDFYTGVLGHYHVQKNKSDPGPAFQWDLVIDGARAILNHQPPSPITAMTQAEAAR